MTVNIVLKNTMTHIRLILAQITQAEQYKQEAINIFARSALAFVFTCFLITGFAIPISQSQQTTEANTQPTEQANTSENLANQTLETTKTPVKRQTLRDIQANRKALLESQYSADAIKEIGSGESSFIGLYEQDKTGNPYGAILIVHGEGQHADWPHTISALRQELPQHGWTSLSITLPEPAKTNIPKRPTPSPQPIENAGDSEQNGDDDNDASTTNDISKSKEKIDADTNTVNHDEAQANTLSAEDIEALAIARVKAAVNFLNDAGQFNIVIAAHGISALRSMNYLANASTMPPNMQNKNMNKKTKIQRPIRAMVFLNARNQTIGNNNTLTDFLNIPDLPILDIYFNAHYLDDIEAKARKKAARNNLVSNYVSLKLLPPSNTIFEDENRFTRRVKGFLHQYARGVEIEAKR